MGGFFGAASRNDCVFDLFYGTDYHSHLGTRRAGLVVYDKEKGFDRAIHNIERASFRSKFEGDAAKMKGFLGIGCISDYEPQPLIIRSHHGTYAITTVGKINNSKELTEYLFANGNSHFLEMSGGEINATELAAALINQKEDLIEGIIHAQNKIDGSLSMLIMTKEGIYGARDRYGRTPLVIGRHEDEGYCFALESFSFRNLEYESEKELGPGEIVFMTPDGYETVIKPREELKICTFMWIYYGFPASSYEGIDVEKARHECGKRLAMRDREHGKVFPDYVTGVPDSGIGHALGYANEAGIPYRRPFVKYTPTWARSFMPTIQTRRNLIARMKLIPVKQLIEGQKMLLVDDSLVRGTQLRATTEYLYENGAKEVHIRPACPPIMYGCKYLNFSRSRSLDELVARRMIEKLEGAMTPSEEIMAEYTNPDSERYKDLLEMIRKDQNFTSLHYHRLDDMLDSIGIEPCKLCTYCWDGKE